MSLTDAVLSRLLRRSGLEKAAVEELIARTAGGSISVASIGGRLHPASSSSGTLDGNVPFDTSSLSDNYTPQPWLSLNETEWELAEPGAYQVILSALSRPGVDPADVVALKLVMQNMNLVFGIPATVHAVGSQSGLLVVSAAPYTLSLMIDAASSVVDESPWVTNGFDAQLDVVKLA